MTQVLPKVMHILKNRCKDNNFQSQKISHQNPLNQHLTFIKLVAQKPSSQLKKNNLVDEKALIAACKQENRKAQQLLFERYSPVMLGVCRRYLKREEDAEDVLVEAFYKVLTNIGQFRDIGSFEGWIRRIVVNEALMFLRRNNALQHAQELTPQTDPSEAASIEEDINARELLNYLDQLPNGYRTVFNLYVLDGLKHREIAELLGISINTSKSQLILAKQRLQEILIQQRYPLQ